MDKRLIGLLAVVVALLVLIFQRLPGQVLQTGSWGLSFQKEGYAPKGPATAEELSRLDILKAHQVPAAFFLVGNYMERNPELVRRMVDEGHIVGNHTMHHYDMSKYSDETAFAKELTDLEDLYRDITGRDMEKYYRPPQGIYSQENLEMAKKLGYKTVFWSLAYVDWNNDAQPSREQAMSKLLPRIHNGAVVLLHSTSRTNAEILDEVLTEWKKMGYSFGRISEIFPG